MDEFGTRPVPDAAWACSRTFVYVDDVDGHHERGRAVGATIINALGQQWTFATPLLTSRARPAIACAAGLR
jgi:hypothetical protein